VTDRWTGGLEADRTLPQLPAGTDARVGGSFNEREKKHMGEKTVCVCVPSLRD
jgi:hypothetical protein